MPNTPSTVHSPSHPQHFKHAFARPTFHRCLRIQSFSHVPSDLKHYALAFIPAASRTSLRTPSVSHIPTTQHCAHALTSGQHLALTLTPAALRAHPRSRSIPHAPSHPHHCTQAPISKPPTQTNASPQDDASHSNLLPIPARQTMPAGSAGPIPSKHASHKISRPGLPAP